MPSSIILSETGGIVNESRVIDDLLRLGPARANHGNGHVEPGIADEQIVNLGQRHFVRALAFDCFENVGACNAGFVRRAAGDHGDHGGIAEALGNGGANVGLGIRAFELCNPCILRWSDSWSSDRAIPATHAARRR